MVGLVQTVTETGREATLDRRRSGFFRGAAIALLLVALVGFGRTFFFRPFFDVPAVPGYVFIHGAVMTAWFVWFLLQTLLIQTNRVALHRRLGVAGMGLAVAVVAMGLVATLGGVGRLLEDVDSRTASVLVWFNFFLLLDFSGCAFAAYLWRQRADVHKRLMLFASISLIGPAFARIAMWPVLGDSGGPINAMPALFLVAIVVHDLLERKRLHLVTAVAGGLSLLTIPLAALVGSSEFGRAFVLGLA